MYRRRIRILCDSRDSDASNTSSKSRANILSPLLRHLSLAVDDTQMHNAQENMAAEFKHLNLFPDFDFYLQSLTANPLPTNQKDPKPQGNRITAYEYVDNLSGDEISPKEPPAQTIPKSADETSKVNWAPTGDNIAARSRDGDALIGPRENAQTRNFIAVKTESRSDSANRKRRKSLGDVIPEMDIHSSYLDLSAKRLKLSTTMRPNQTLASLTNLPKPPHPIPIYKQQNTTLRVYMPPLTEFIPLRLRSCMTIYSFFDNVLCAFEKPAEKVAALRITFESVPDGPAEMKTWLVKKNVPDSYDIFLDVLNELPGWSETAKCSVRVDIILRR